MLGFVYAECQQNDTLQNDITSVVMFSFVYAECQIFIAMISVIMLSVRIMTACIVA